MKNETEKTCGNCRNSWIGTARKLFCDLKKGEEVDKDGSCDEFKEVLHHQCRDCDNLGEFSQCLELYERDGSYKEVAPTDYCSWWKEKKK